MIPVLTMASPFSIWAAISAFMLQQALIGRNVLSIRCDREPAEPGCMSIEVDDKGGVLMASLKNLRLLSKIASQPSGW